MLVTTAIEARRGMNNRRATKAHCSSKMMKGVVFGLSFTLTSRRHSMPSTAMSMSFTMSVIKRSATIDKLKKAMNFVLQPVGVASS
mmetsp:Transcript_53946/g.61048  ORF Transcript_53946/g.61048 Transcript_53946/m.61048 type:complete len:86 (+) Transcript_53946:1112-1369(+)